MNSRLVRYRQANSGYIYSLHPRSGFVDTPMGHTPRWYELTGNSISVFPWDEVPAGDTLLVDYYKIPDTLSGTMPFPVPRLVPTVKLEVIHRVMIFNRDLQSAAALKGEAVDNEMRARPSH